MNIKRIFLNASKTLNFKPTFSTLLLYKDYNIINLLIKKGKKLHLQTPINFNDKGEIILKPLQQTPISLNNKNLKIQKKNRLLSYHPFKKEKDNEGNNILYTPKNKFMYRTKSSILLKNHNFKNSKKNVLLNPITIKQSLKITHISYKNISPKINAGTQINDDNIQNYSAKTYYKKKHNNKIKCKYPLFKNRTLMYKKKNYAIYE